MKKSKHNDQKGQTKKRAEKEQLLTSTFCGTLFLLFTEFKRREERKERTL